MTQIEPMKATGQLNLENLTRLELSNLPERKVVLYGPSNDHITRTIKATNRFYEWFLLTAIDTFVSSGDLVIDVGANIGNHTIFFAASKSARVIAFEPQPDIAEILQHNAEYNFLDHLIEVRRRALGETTNSGIGTHTVGNSGATRIELGDGDIEVSTLDSEAIPGRVRVLKVDVEGMELQVLRGGRNLIEQDRPVVTCEISNAQDLSELTAWAADMGYTFAGKYNSTPTYLLLPYRTAQEVAEFNRYQSATVVETNLMARDHAYRINVLSTRLAALEERIGKLESD